MPGSFKGVVGGHSAFLYAFCVVPSATHGISPPRIPEDLNRRRALAHLVGKPAVNGIGVGGGLGGGQSDGAKGARSREVDGGMGLVMEAW